MVEMVGAVVEHHDMSVACRRRMLAVHGITVRMMVQRSNLVLRMLVRGIVNVTLAFRASRNLSSCAAGRRALNPRRTLRHQRLKIVKDDVSHLGSKARPSRSVLHDAVCERIRLVRIFAVVKSGPVEMRPSHGLTRFGIPNLFCCGNGLSVSIYVLLFRKRS